MSPGRHSAGGFSIDAPGQVLPLPWRKKALSPCTARFLEAEVIFAYPASAHAVIYTACQKEILRRYGDFHL